MSSPNGADKLAAQPATADTGLHLAIDADRLYAMRAAVAAHASELGLTPPKLGSLLVVATELAANTIRHGGGAGTLRLWRAGNAIQCEISDNGPGIADPQHVGIHPVDLRSEGGRGLWLSRKLSDGLTIHNRNPGSAVTVTMIV